MAFSVVRIISCLNSRRLVFNYRSLFTVQVRHFRDRLTPISKCNCRVVSREHRRLSLLPGRFSFAGCQTSVRWNSASSASSGVQNAGREAVTQQYIPEPPSPPVSAPVSDDTASEIGLEIVEQLTTLGEPTLRSLGLASWYPNGWVQAGLEAVHVGLNLPWWSTIVVSTVILRLTIFPLVVYVQKNMALMNNHMPKVQDMQVKFNKARRRGDMVEASRLGIKLANYMKEHKVKPFKNAMGPMTQVPIFLSVFIGLRQMANLPIESMKTGGLAWFTDLTIPDPYYVLPVATVCMLYAVIEIGVDGMKAAAMPKMGRIFMRVMPFVILPFIMNFPAALLCYWFSSNCIAMIQAAFLRIPRVRQMFNIPDMVYEKPDPTKPKQRFVQTVKDTMKEAQTDSLESLKRSEATKFKEAGYGAVPKTYPYDPTKLRKPAAAAAKAK